MTKKTRKKEWFDNEAFWREMYPFMFSEKRFAETEEQVEKALALINPTGKVALDLCCGPGRYAIALATRGFSVTGVDTSTYLLNKARTKARTARVKIHWVQQDMRDFVRPNTFDLVLNMFTSFGYFDNKADDLLVLKNMFTSLRPGGRCLIEMVGKEILAKNFLATSSLSLPDGRMLVERREIFDDWTRIQNEWLLIHRNGVKRFTFHHTLYSGQELRNRMEQVGFVDVTLYGNFDGDEYGLDAQRLIAVGYKPAT